MVFLFEQKTAYDVRSSDWSSDVCSSDLPQRFGPVSAIGLDETLFVRTGSWGHRSWVTSIVDVARPAQLLDVVEGRSAKAPTDWLTAQIGRASCRGRVCQYG